MSRSVTWILHFSLKVRSRVVVIVNYCLDSLKTFCCSCWYVFCLRNFVSVFIYFVGNLWWDFTSIPERESSSFILIDTSTVFTHTHRYKHCLHLRIITHIYYSILTISKISVLYYVSTIYRILHELSFNIDFYETSLGNISVSQSSLSFSSSWKII